MTELLRHHGDQDARPGLVDLAVNVRSGTPPRWLRDRLAGVDLARYPDPTAARGAIAARHGRSVDEVLPTAGAAEAFVLIARALRPAHAVVVAPQFTEPELALRAAGHRVTRLVLDPPFEFDAGSIPADADLVVIGNPTNPTSRLHSTEALRELLRPGRPVVVDEAFADCVPGEIASLAGDPDFVVIRSLTKTWGLAGLRVGYLLAQPKIVAALAAAQPHWAVSAPALEACVACSEPGALAEAARWAAALQVQRAGFARQLVELPGAQVVPHAAGPFVLVHTELAAAWNPLRGKGFAVRRGDTFPGLDEHWIRVAVRDETICTAFVNALSEVLG